MVQVKKHHPPFSAASSLGSDHFAHCKDRFQDPSRLDHTLFRSTRDHSSSSPAAPPKLPALAAPVPGRFPDAPRCSFSTPNLLKHRFYPASSLPSNIPCACGAVTVLFNPCSTPWFRRARHVVQLDHNYHRGNVSTRRNPVCHAVSFTCVVGSLLTSRETPGASHRPPRPAAGTVTSRQSQLLVAKLSFRPLVVNVLHKLKALAPRVEADTPHHQPTRPVLFRTCAFPTRRGPELLP